MADDVTVKMDVEAFARQLQRAGDTLAAGEHPALREGQRAGGAAYLDFIRRRFLAQGNGEWAPLAPSTVRRKEKLGLDERIGFESGRMYESFSPGGAGNVLSTSGLTTAAGSADPNIRTFQYGSRRQPARPVVIPPDAQAVGDVARAHAAGVVGVMRAVFGSGT